MSASIKFHGLMKPLDGIVLDKDNIPANPQENMFFVINGQPSYYGRRHPGGNLEWISLFEGEVIESLTSALNQANQTIATMQSSIANLQATVASLQVVQTDFNSAMDTIANSINSIANAINP